MRKMLRMRRKFALILCAICFSVFIFIYFLLNHSIANEKNDATKFQQSSSKSVNHKHRGDSGDVPAKRMKKQETEIMRNEIMPERPAIEAPFHGDNQNSQCRFRTDIEPKPDIQMLDVYETIPFENADGGPWKQGWRVTYDEHEWNSHHKLKVFVVPHSHNDPGWIKTFDEYYDQLTKSILTNMLSHLIENPDMTFIWAEISYFSRWYENLSTDEKDDVKTLLKRRQLEFVTGGWVMPDEANSHWLSILQQLTEGQTWLKTHLNVTPKSSWSIDPFGQSSVMALILKGADFENMLIQRTHYEVKKYLAKRKQLEFRWRQLWDSNGDTDIFAHMMPFYSYDVPHTCGPDPKVCCQFDFKRLPGYGLTCPWRIPPRPIDDSNVKKRSELIVDQWKKKATLYKTRALLIPLGDDFRYNQNTEWEAQRKNFEKLFEFINNEPSLHVEVKFGTLQEYFDAVHAEKKLHEFPSLSGDFFTYADREDHYWSGYFTSRPYHKRLDRILLNYLRSAEMLHAWSDWNDENQLENHLQGARRALSLFQHHDGITGTARDHVVKDYERQMMDALKSCKFVIQQAAYRHLTKPSIYQPDYKFTYFNIDDSRTIGMNDNRPTIILGESLPIKYVVLHNSLPRYRQEIVDFHVSKPFVMVEDLDGRAIESQIIPVWSWHKGAYGTLVPQVSTTKYRLLFKAKVPSLGLSTYIIRSTNSVSQSLGTTFSKLQIFTQFPFSVNLPDYPNQVEFSEPRDITLRVGNEGLSASFNSKGLLKSMSTNTDEHFPIHMEFLKYGAARGAERSGAYLFLPDGPAIPMKQPGSITVLLTTGNLESSIATGLPYVIHKNIFRSGEKALEIRNKVDVGDLSNTEIIMRMSTGIESKDVFYTDLNGFEYIKRKRFTKLPIQANYYPIPSGMYIEDDANRLTLLTAQPLGGSSLASGEIEIMQDRRLDQDDNRGLGQGVQDNVPILNIFKLKVESMSSCEKRSEKYRGGYLTSTMHTEMNRLLHPMEKLVWHENDWIGVQPNFGEERSSLDIGTEIAVLRNLKHVATNSHKKSTMGLVINRVHLEQCKDENASSDTINIHQTLGINQNLDIFNSSLTLLRKKSQIKTPSMNICPMEIKAFIINR
ncbi:alpha-mannosidase 2 [Contarinia nasturtii]|uniref:alpha-mannosidase 2 n=1 Tax=Contarinia nasturtii TaxID=265458 RepID=UPI0012D38974|nr:alpha-mannosidase 2 [Contarinia nasturtii]